MKAAVKPRFVLHAVMAAGVSLVVFAGHGSNAQPTLGLLAQPTAGYGSAMDAASAASVAASVAAKTNLLVSADATKQATTLNQQVALPTSDSDTLEKRQVVTTAGDATRNISSYTVQPGDTLSQIAAKFNITTDTVLWANNLDNADSIKPGQTLTMLPVSGLLYTVQDGDTVASLADKYQANAQQILSYNNAEVKGLQPGMKIIIPDGVKQTPVKPAAVQAPAYSASYTPRLTYFAGGANGYDFGYCTWYVATRRSIPGYWGNANQWYYNAQASGFSVGSVPEPGAIAWTGRGYYGHVAYVEAVSGGMAYIAEMNGSAGWGRVDRQWVPASSFLYIY